jgi:hypothetical protein
MHRPHLLLAALCCAVNSFAQQSDTLLIHYKPDQYHISKPAKLLLDSFIQKGWDRLFIRGFTDETEGEEYNLALSKKRSGEVSNYFLDKKIPETAIVSQHFGEAMPKADNSTEEGKALNRRTEIIGIRFAKVKMMPAQPKVDLMLPVTRTLDNGIIITYRPGLLPDYLASEFEGGFGSRIEMISNTTQMRQNNLFNNTTNGEILSSVMILCGTQLNPCKLDSAILVKVPVPFQTKCPINKVKFFNTVVENGKRIWKEQTKFIQPEIINGQQYVGVWIDDFCECLNFDFKIDPECYDTDSTRVFYTKGSIRDLNAELIGFNSVYMPRKLNDTTHHILFMKNKLKEAPISFSLYEGKRRIRGYKNKVLSDFPFDEATKRYQLVSAKKSIRFSKLDVWYVVLNVNGDKYRVPAEQNRFDFTYLSYKKDSILVDFMILDSKNRMTHFRNQPLASLPYDQEKGYYLVDKKLIKELKHKTSIAGK